MTPKEKAEELIFKFKNSQDSDGYNDVRDMEAAKRCALIAVDEIIDAIDWHEYEVPNDQLKFWFNVKKEIEKL